MRPAVPDPLLPARPRKASITDCIGSTPFTERASAEPESFFLTREDDMQRPESSLSGGTRDSTYGVQSLEETMNWAKQPHDQQPDIPEDRSQVEDRPAYPYRRTTAIRTGEATGTEPSRPSSSRDGNPSLPLTPLTFGSPAAPASLASSPKSTSIHSFRASCDASIQDEGGSRGATSEDDDSLVDSSDLRDSVPQLVMPSIRMPSRRPFTERGRSIGRLKLLVAGATGTGKSSLLKSIVQISEDIVHVDPLPQNSRPTRTSNRSRAGSSLGNKHRRVREQASIEEIYASTKPYPPWWTDLEDSRVLKRRKSTGEVVLERNLCFVDTTNGKLNRTDQTELEIRYMNQQFQRATGAVRSTNRDLQGLLSGNGGSQVDAVLYLISKDTITSDIQCIRRLSDFTNVIPLISKVDTLSEEQIHSLKQAYLQKALDAGIRPFFFGSSPLGPDDPIIHQAPFSVSSANTTDDENMDASILMNPDYIQPLAQSELGYLLDKMFERDNLAWLRHSAAKKLVQANNLHKLPSQQPTEASMSGVSSEFANSPSASPFDSISSSHVFVSRPHSANLSTYTLARMTDHTQREESLAQLHLAKWAADLQQSLQNERRRYESLAHHERAAWLSERLDECVADGTLIPAGQSCETPGFHKESGTLTVKCRDGHRLRYRIASMAQQDPLGLIRWNDNMKRRGWVLVQVLGGVGVVGGIALWIARAWGLTSQDFSNWFRV